VPDSLLFSLLSPQIIRYTPVHDTEMLWEVLEEAGEEKHEKKREYGHYMGR
jgi:hypothetical protein